MLGLLCSVAISPGRRPRRPAAALPLAAAVADVAALAAALGLPPVVDRNCLAGSAWSRRGARPLPVLGFVKMCGERLWSAAFVVSPLLSFF